MQSDDKDMLNDAAFVVTVALLYGLLMNGIICIFVYLA